MPSPSVRQRVWFSLEPEKYDKHIPDRSELSVRQVREMRRDCEQFGEVVKPQFKAAGRLKKLRELHNQTPLEYLEERPTAYRDEMEWFSWDEFNPAADESKISRDLGWNRKGQPAKQNSKIPFSQ